MWYRQPEDDASSDAYEGAGRITLDIDPDVVRRSRRERALTLNVVRIPLLRLAGCNLLLLAVVLHDLFIRAAPQSATWILPAVAIEAYCVISWLVLYFFYQRARPFDLGVFFLVADIPVWLTAIYWTGGEQSWLFFVLLLRVGDQVNTTFRRALLFAHAVTLGYASMLLYEQVFDHRAIGMAGITKLIFVYGGALYISVAAKGAADRRKATAAAVRMSRELIRRLEKEKLQSQELREHAEAASHAKSAFLANVSHEMRTPLNAILGMTQLALTSEAGREQREHFETVRASAKSLLAVIEDVLDFSKIEAEKLEIEDIPFSLRETVFNTLKTFGYEAYSKGLELVGFVSPLAPDRFSGDPVRLRQILVNLVANAIKFTNHGGVDVRVNVEEIVDRDVILHFAVVDTGAGIPKEQHRSIFDPFAQADSSILRKYGGTGLGLSISARLVELMKGSIWVESDPGSGSAFHFTVRLKGRHEILATPVSHQPRDRRILIADREIAARTAAAEMYRAWGNGVVTCGGINELHDALDGVIAFDAALVDAALIADAPPALVQRIRSHAMITSAILPHPGEGRLAARVRSIGVMRFVTRPISEDELRDVFRSEPTPLVVETLAPTANSRSLRILVVDDERVNQEVTAGLLKRLGHETQVCGSAAEALTAIHSSHFDLLMLDVQMPEVDGLRLTEMIREEEIAEARTRVPIVAVTGHAVKGYRDVCVAHGMDDYMTKPVRIEQLRQVVESVIDRFYVRAPQDAGPAVTGAFDDVDEDLLRKISKIFLENYEPMLAGIDRALAVRDVGALGDAAHRLKGSISNFHAPALFATAERLEMLGKRGNFAEAQSTFEELAAELARFRPLLEARLSTRSLAGD